MFNEFIMPILETVASSASPIISLFALYIALLARRANMSVSRNIQHYSAVTKADSLLAGNKDFLRFHGINPDTIQDKYGVTAAELSYLVQSFNSGSISNLLSNDGFKKPFEEGSYWYDILKNEPTQKAFPLIKLLFDSKNHYIARCEKTIHLIKKMDTVRRQH